MAIRTVDLAASDNGLAKAVTDSVAQLLELGYVAGSAEPGHEPILMPFTPVARRNPFQKLLYSRAWDNGFAPVPTNGPRVLASGLWPGRMVCHFHWLGSWTAGITKKRKLDAAVTDFQNVLSNMTSQGIQLLWTVHNVLPHESETPEHDRQIRQSLVDAGAILHIMNRSTMDEVELERVSADRVFRTPLPGFTGTYPDFVSKPDARFELDVRPSDFVFILFGRVSPYKGLDELVSSFIDLVNSEQPGDRRAHLVIAGAMNNSDFSRELLVELTTNRRIHLFPKTITDSDAQIFLRAADAMVCPYQVSLNSAAAMLGHAFDLRVVCPRTSTFLEYEASGLARYYEPSSPNGLRDVMRSVAAETEEPTGGELPEWNVKAVSDSFFSQLREHLTF